MPVVLKGWKILNSKKVGRFSRIKIRYRTLVKKPGANKVSFEKLRKEFRIPFYQRNPNRVSAIMVSYSVTVSRKTKIKRMLRPLAKYLFLI